VLIFDDVKMNNDDLETLKDSIEWFISGSTSSNDYHESIETENININKTLISEKETTQKTTTKKVYCCNFGNCTKQYAQRYHFKFILEHILEKSLTNVHIARRVSQKKEMLKFMFAFIQEKNLFPVNMKIATNNLKLMDN